jgi:hypothetical protein
LSDRSSLNVLAAYRKIPILGAPPVSITYTRARTRAVYRKSIDELYQMLTLMEGPTAVADRARLSTLDPKDKYLAVTKPHYDNIRANITYSSRLSIRTRLRYSPMPIVRSVRADVLTCRQFGFLKRNRNWSV